ncbi:MAG: S49 family peptidase [Candidatus Puniceispirillum sp.]
MGLMRKLMFWRRLRPIVPVVRLSGVISSGSSLGRRGLSLESVEPQLKKAFSVKQAKAVALIINSPGGSPVQSSLIGQRIRDLASQNDLPVLAFCEDVAASGGYWIAAAADEVFANAASVIGSIGVISAGFGFDKAIARLGVDRRVYTAGNAKMTLDPFQPERTNEVDRLKALQADIHQQFITHIETRRGSRLKGDRDALFSGAFWTGQTALELGLIDAIGECRQTLLNRFGSETEIMMIEPKRKLLPFGVSGMSSRLVEDAAAVAIERAYFSRFGL